ncbi:hypothetical protein RAE07_07940 [Corynebacterium kefirresidentii]|mgnify:FL=1|uniref:hypothetical protein n=1 Tax=Corynebacterium TaxID=1716 RepID=UPI00223B21A2|nr:MULTISPECIES: hypothetical protein [Corynebacterium]MCT2187371.1 hypothetical protein [Corynebacterium kefirresidentii]MDU4729081.1 hypothetical protein [Corynebacterium sp.]MDV2415248.1 hypothetical protein [Corynebacterium kefirresidentii]
MALYPLATSYFGVEHVAVLEHPVLGTALSIPGVAEHAALVDVSLEPDTYTNGWRIRSDFGFLGFLDEVEAAEYPALERLKNSFAQPQTSATVEVVDGKVEVAVSLGMWPWMVPVNDQPQGTALLAGGRGVLIDVAAGDLSSPQLQCMGTQQFFVTLEDLSGTAVATCDDMVLGPCGDIASLPGLRAAFEAASASGAGLSARAYTSHGMLAVDIPADTATTEEIFSPAVPPLRVPAPQPAIPAAAPASMPTQPEVWDHTVSGETIVTALPTGSRRPQGPHAQPAAPAAPSQTASPQQTAHSATPPKASAKLAELVSSVPGEQSFSWRVLPVAEEPGRYSSESARVRARRVARETSHHRGGNHRK